MWILVPFLATIPYTANNYRPFSFRNTIRAAKFRHLRRVNDLLLSKNSDIAIDDNVSSLIYPKTSQ